MKKLGIGMFCMALCLAVALIFPQVGTSNPLVDDDGCLECHDATFPAPGTGALHDIHTTCDACHVDIGDTPLSSTCIVCHPMGDTGKCPLVDEHQAMTDCLDCHDECAPEETTTTTTADVETSTTTTIEEETTEFSSNHTLIIAPEVVHQLINSGNEEIFLLATFSSTPANVFTPEGEKLEVAPEICTSR